MEKEKIEKIMQGLKCCGNNSVVASCACCPYVTNRDDAVTCTVRLLSDCGELVAELTGAKV